MSTVLLHAVHSVVMSNELNLPFPRGPPVRVLLKCHTERDQRRKEIKNVSLTGRVG